MTLTTMARCAVLSLSLLVVIALLQGCEATTFLWNPEGSWQRPSQSSGTPVCVDIPVNMSLCHGIGYTKMRLPNLLHHDSLQEVSQQAVSWVPLFQLGCHPDTQLFLCSLFTPVCLDHPIPPCRSLCTAVQASCEKTMSKYGYPWPSIVNCDQFPVDNDMCIMAQHGQGGIMGEPEPPKAKKPSVSGPGRNRGEAGKDKQRARDQSKGEKRRKNKNRQKHNQERTRNAQLAVANEDQAAPSRDIAPKRPPHHHLQTLPQIVEKPQPVVYSAAHYEKKKVARSEPTPASVSNSDAQPIDSRRKLHNLILARYCGAQWSLKARALVERKPDGELVLRLRNYRVLHGTFRQDMKSVEVIVPANVSREMIATDGEGLQPGGDARRRYYLMGESRGKVNIARLAIPWPHKMGQFRKALKLIKSGDVECESSASVTETPSPSSSIQQAPHSSVEPLDSASSSNAEERLSSRAEKRKRRKEEKQRQRQARLREEQK